MARSWQGLTRLLLTTSLLEQTAQGHSIAFAPLVLHELGYGPTDVAIWTGLLYTINMASALPLTPFWGVLGERYSRRAMILRAYLAYTVGYFLISIASDLTLLIVARLLFGLAFGNVSTIIATQAYFTPRQHLGKALAVVQAAQPIAASLGPPLGAALLPFIGWRGLFRLDAALVMLSALLIVFLLPEPGSSVRKEPILARVKNVIVYCWETPVVRWNYIAWFTLRGATSLVESYLPVRITQLAGPDPANAIGVILGLYGALTSVATWFVGRFLDKVDETKLYWRAMIAATITTAGLAFSPFVWLLGVFALVRAIPMAMSSTILFTHLARSLPREQQTAVLGIGVFPRTAGALVFTFLVTFFAPFGASAVLAGSTLAYVVCVLTGFKLSKVTPAASPERERSIVEKS